MIIINESQDKDYKLQVRKFDNSDYREFLGFEESKKEPAMVAEFKGNDLHMDDEDMLVVLCGKSTDEYGGSYVLVATYDYDTEVSKSFKSYKDAVDALDKFVKDYNKVKPATVDEIAKLCSKHKLK